MEIIDDFGLTVGSLSTEEALAPVPDDGVDVLRVESPDPAVWDALRDRGFVPKPAKISWLAEVMADDEAFLRTLAKKDRWNIRSARRAAAESGVRFTVEDPVGEAGLDAFLRIYSDQIARMRFGHPYAASHRASILSGAAPYFAVWAWVGGELAGGCLVYADPAAPFAKIRFAAVDQRFRDTALSRVVFLEGVRAVRERGFGTASVGTEPNLYGHVAKAGLYSFKLRIGFTPLPSQLAGNAGSDVADRIVRLKTLEDPAFMLAYPWPPDGWRGGHAHFYTGSADLDLSPYRPALMAGTTVIRL